MKEYRINPRFTITEMEQIERLAALEGCSKSEIVRKATQEYINPKVSKENIDYITKIIRLEIKNTQEPDFERIISLLAKTCIMSATSAFLTAETINRFVPDNKQQDVKEVYDAARLKAVNYLKEKGTE